MNIYVKFLFISVLLFSTVTTSTSIDDSQYTRLTEDFTPIVIGQRHYTNDEKVAKPTRFTDITPIRINKYQNRPEEKFPDEDEDEDNREFTVGAHFQVGHLPPAALGSSDSSGPSKITNLKIKKNTYYSPSASGDSFDPSIINPNEKAFSYTNFHITTNENNNYKKYKSDIQPITFSSRKTVKNLKKIKKPIFKPAEELDEHLTSTIKTVNLPNFPSSSYSDDNEHYEVRGIDQDPRSFKPNFKLQDVPNLYDREQKYRSVASRGQIEKFLEDQQKLIDENVELQLLNDPNPAARGKYQQFLKSKDDERIEKEYEENHKKSSKNEKIHGFPGSTGINYHRKSKSSLNSGKKHIKKIVTPGLGQYRTFKIDSSNLPSTYKFSLDI